jgi:uncharacterized protein YqeY
MKSISGFGFKSGIDGMSKMVKQAMLLRTNIESIGALSMKDMGKIMTPAKEKIGGSCDGKRINDLVKKLLG